MPLSQPQTLAIAPTTQPSISPPLATQAFDFSRKGSNINQQIVGGAYGGYKFPTWGNLYGGNVLGQTMLHLAVRPDNECYANRYLIAKTLVQDLKIDTSIRDEHEVSQLITPLPP